MMTKMLARICKQKQNEVVMDNNLPLSITKTFEELEDVQYKLLNANQKKTEQIKLRIPPPL